MNAPLFVYDSITREGAGERFGAKAAGLLDVPEAWRPACLFISRELYDQWKADGGIFQGIDPIALSAEVARIEEVIGSRWLIRSSATDETVEDRGANRSERYDVSSGVDALLATIDNIFRDYDASDAHAMALVLNPLIEVVQKGHLSNDHRAVDKPYRWYVEGYQGGQLVTSSYHSAKQAQHFDVLTPLVATNASELKSRVRSVGAHFWRLGTRRVLLEWCWDGARLWLVQLDVFHRDYHGFNPTTQELSGYVWPSLEEGKTFRRYRPGAYSKWGKLQRISEFKRGSEPPPHRLFWVTAADAVEAIEADRQALIEEVSALTGDKAVLRTDTIEGGFNKDRTHTLSAEAAVKWIEERAAKVPVDDRASFIFIMHAFIPARAAAWSLYALDGQAVLVEGLWGLADGMQYNSADTYWYDVPGKREVGLKQRYKGHVLIEDADGKWSKKEVAPAYARYRALTKAEVEEIALRTADIAANCGADVQIMWFVGIDERAGIGRCLPWFRITPTDKPVQPSRSTILNSVKIRTIEDLRQLDNVERNSVKVELFPEIDDVRSEEFIRAVSETCKRLNLPVELRGGILSHAYYLLRRAGVEVFSSEPGVIPQEFTRRKEFNKVVRDQIPEYIEGRGEIVSSDQLAPDQMVRALVGKLIEEAAELLSADRIGAKKEEMADIFEVIRGISVSMNVNLGEVIALANKKREKRGGFESGVVLRETARPTASGDPELFENSRQVRVNRRLDEFLSIDVADNKARVPVSLLVGKAAGTPLSFDLGSHRVLANLRLVGGHVVLDVEDAPIDDQPSLFPE